MVVNIAPTNDNVDSETVDSEIASSLFAYPILAPFLPIKRMGTSIRSAATEKPHVAAYKTQVIAINGVRSRK